MSERIAVAGATAKKKIPREAILEAVKAAAAQHHVTVQALDAQAVFGRQHVVSAAMHAQRAKERNETIAKDLGAEIALYASGERQINKALVRVGLPAEAGALAFVAIGEEGEQAIADVLARLNLQRDDGALAPKPSALVRLGVRRIEGIDPLELVLEKVALLDAIK